MSGTVATLRAGAQLPLCDLDAEAAVLSTLMLEPEKFESVAAVLRTRHFHSDAHRQVFAAISQLRADEKSVDVVSLAKALRDAGNLDRVGGSPFLGQLVDATPATAHVVEHAQCVAEYARKRRIATEAENLAQSIRQGDSLASVAERIEGLKRVANPETDALKFPLRSLSDEMGVEDEPIDWTWSDRHMVAPGRPTILGAYGGIGKTWTVLAAALSVATGIPFLGSPPRNTGRAVILSYETGRRRLLRRLRRLVTGYGVGGDLSGLQFAAQEDLTTYLTSPEAELALSQLCRGVRLLVVDSLIQGSPGLRENDAEMAAPLHLLARVSARTGCAVVVIHHERKATQDAAGGAGQSLRGHSSLQAACDAIWRMSAGDDGKVQMRATKSSDGPTPQGWNLEIVDVDGGGIVIEASDEPTHAHSSGGIEDADARVLELIRENPGSGARDLRGLARPLRNQAVDDAVARLVASGQVERRPGTRGAIRHYPKGAEG